MDNQYFIEADIDGVKLKLKTGEGIFSPQAVDRGTLAMLSGLRLTEKDKVLDLGCGCGVVGIYAAKLIGADKVVMCDISAEAVAAAQYNVQQNDVMGAGVIVSDGLAGVEDDDFTVILSNPPYHTDFSVAKGFIEEGFRRLAVEGRMYMVTKRRDWYENKLRAVFGGVRTEVIDGYFVFTAEKRGEMRTAHKKPNENKLSKKLMRRQAGRRKV